MILQGDMCMDSRNRAEHDIIEDLIVFLEYFQRDGDNLTCIQESQPGPAPEGKNLEAGAVHEGFCRQDAGRFFCLPCGRK